MTVSSFHFCVGSGNVTETQDAEFCIIVLLEIRGRLSCSYLCPLLGADEVSGESLQLVTDLYGESSGLIFCE